MGNALEQFDPASEGFALIVESLEAAGLSLEAGEGEITAGIARGYDIDNTGRGRNGT